MPRSRTLTLIRSAATRADLIRLREFIEPHRPEAARSAAQSLPTAARLIVGHPGMGRRLEGRQDSKLVVPFGQRVYIIRYRLDEDVVVILKIWHGLEDRES